MANYSVLAGDVPVGGGSFFAPPISPAGSTPYADYAKQVNDLMTEQARKAYISNLPGYLSNITQQSANVSDLLKGQLPTDVMSAIFQGGAERGIATGSPGSPNANAATLRALGLTSLDAQKMGTDILNTSIQQTPVPQLFNPASIAVPTTLAGMEHSAAAASAPGKPVDPLWHSSPWASPPVSASSGTGRILGPGIPRVSYGPSQVFGPLGGTSTVPFTDQQIMAIANGDIENQKGGSSYEWLGDTVGNMLDDQQPQFDMNDTGWSPQDFDYYGE